MTSIIRLYFPGICSLHQREHDGKCRPPAILRINPYHATMLGNYLLADCQAKPGTLLLGRIKGGKEILNGFRRYTGTIISNLDRHHTGTAFPFLVHTVLGNDPAGDFNYP